MTIFFVWPFFSPFRFTFYLKKKKAQQKISKGNNEKRNISIENEK